MNNHVFTWYVMINLNANALVVCLSEYWYQLRPQIILTILYPLRKTTIVDIIAHTHTHY